jgi:hypothetical protein
MKGIIYAHRLLESKDTKSGEKTVRVVVTKEKNCYLVWVLADDYDHLVKFFYDWSRNEAIEYAVDFARGLSGKNEVEIAESLGEKLY